MKQAYNIVARKLKERVAKNKNRRDKGTCLGPLQTGGRVLVRNYTEYGSTGKSRSYWKNDIYKIVDCKGKNKLVYEVQPEKSQNGKIRRVLHTNILLLCKAILEEPEGFNLNKE